MKNWHTSFYAQLAYMAPMGLGFLFQPNLVLSTLGLEPTQEPWIRLVGLLALVLTYYYFNAVRTDSADFARASVSGRLFFCAGLAIVAAQFDMKILFVFVVIEAALAIWTRMTLPKD
jgi:EamA domain-containing membrane protein RarD